MTPKQRTELLRLLELWLNEVRATGVKEKHPIVHSANLTYSFVNATLQHQVGRN